MRRAARLVLIEPTHPEHWQRRRTPQAGTSWFSMNSSIGGGPQT
jgi:hypothetical protein